MVSGAELCSSISLTRTIAPNGRGRSSGIGGSTFPSRSWLTSSSWAARLISTSQAVHPGVAVGGAEDEEDEEDGCVTNSPTITPVLELDDHEEGVVHEDEAKEVVHPGPTSGASSHCDVGVHEAELEEGVGFTKDAAGSSSCGGLSGVCTSQVGCGEAGHVLFSQASAFLAAISSSLHFSQYLYFASLSTEFTPTRKSTHTNCHIRCAAIAAMRGTSVNFFTRRTSSQWATETALLKSAHICFPSLKISFRFTTNDKKNLTQSREYRFPKIKDEREGIHEMHVMLHHCRISIHVTEATKGDRHQSFISHPTT